MSKGKLTERLENFRNGRWIDLVRDSEEIGDQVASARRRQWRRGDDVESRGGIVIRSLEGAEVAPGNLATFGALTDTTRRPAVPREPLPRRILEMAPAHLFRLDEGQFSKNLRPPAIVGQSS